MTVADVLIVLVSGLLIAAVLAAWAITASRPLPRPIRRRAPADSTHQEGGYRWEPGSLAGFDRHAAVPSDGRSNFPVDVWPPSMQLPGVSVPDNSTPAPCCPSYNECSTADSPTYSGCES
ncbi:hypothetical protein [Lysobacter sp. CA196]|uniref:hypothetical protein n=1 Tax=Lysobacter sp. CA196 TaxID=3455606 RepID=UPI003F8D481A